MEVIEHVEERILRPLPLQILDVVDDEDVYLHVEGQEIRQLVVHVDGIHELCLELVAADIEDDEVRILLVDADADGLGEMRLAETGATEDEERIEWGIAGREGDVLPYRDTHLVALPFDQVGETIDGIETGVDVDPLQSGIHERTGRRTRLIGADRDGLVDRRVAVDLRELHHRLDLDGTDLVDQLGPRTDHALERHLDHVEEGVLQILAEEIGRNLDGQRGVDDGDRPDRLEPGLELTGLDYLLNDAQTVFPNIDMSVLNLHF